MSDDEASPYDHNATTCRWCAEVEPMWRGDFCSVAGCHLTVCSDLGLCWAHSE